MPSLSISAALLILGEHDSLPWSSSTWQSHTGITGIPWETPTGASPDDPAPNARGWTVRTAQCVKTYAQNLWSKPPTARIQYALRGYTDNDAVGRGAWNMFVQSGVREWGFSKTIDNILKDCKLTPYEVLARAKSKTVSYILTNQIYSTDNTEQLPTVDDGKVFQHIEEATLTLHAAQVLTIAHLPLASVLFGDDAFSEDGPFLVGPIKDFCDVVLVQTWHRYRKGLAREDKLMAKNHIALEAALQGQSIRSICVYNYIHTKY